MTETTDATPKTLFSSTSGYALAVPMVIGLIAFVAGIIVTPHRAWLNLLVNNFYFLGLAVTAGVFIAMHYLSGAGWPTAIRRIPEAMTAFIPFGAGAMLLLILGSHSVYEWTHSDVVARDAILKAKSGYLNMPFFVVRMFAFIGVWFWLCREMVRQSRAQDTDGALGHTNRNFKLSAIFTVTYAITFTFASIDWVMSLDPHWYSTLFPWYMFAGAMVNMFAVLTLLLILLRRKGLYREVNDHHFHDLGKYIFGFSFFWGYLWFSQFMLIWYSNIPEETVYFAVRQSDGWYGLFLANVIINLFIPFLYLLPARFKMTEKTLLPVCALIIVGRWLDLYIMVMPSHFKEGPSIGWMEIFMFVGMAGFFVTVFDQALRGAKLVPEKDPYIEESLHHHA